LFGHEDIDGGKAFFSDALAAARRVEDRVTGAYAVLGLAFCAVAEGHQRAAELHGLADGLLQQCDEEIDELQRDRQRREHAMLLKRLGASRFEARYAVGKQSAEDGTLEAAVFYAWGE